MPQLDLRLGEYTEYGAAELEQFEEAASVRMARYDVAMFDQAIEKCVRIVEELVDRYAHPIV